ncbi:hypothetical protein [Ruminococcus sp.]|uniref:hypothetical protein n=1 Tax=Ruminococcus sp. TaxID=41978 RepID=UPI0026000A98|nr:hypothetical protein [Ruminococcus sp.]MBR1433243.1 hypothetical protein [Ruminococcus sp.]
MENTKTAISVAENTENKKPGRTKLSRAYGKIQKGILAFHTMIIMWMLSSVTAFADGENPSGGGISDKGGDQFWQVVNFFATWIGRIGLVVGFVGAVMFALAIKNDDADAKTRGLMTLASGFVVFAVSMSLELFKNVT